ncbi:hypothetical protein BJV78DRAFT_1209659 [Lactifluus subvellereus]|nr:hypothetical protein BJV78DRAFT_1209659 [Lactifluus subvellereus]
MDLKLENIMSDPKRNAPGTPLGSESYSPSSGNGPQTAYAYTQDGSSRSHSIASVPADIGALSRSVYPGVPSSRPSHHHSTSPPALSRHVPVPAPQGRASNVRSPPYLVPLEYLQSCSNTRDPTDERMVQQLSVSRTPNAGPSRSPVSPGVNPGCVTPYNDLRSP